jgi:hypothetical protein
MLFNKLKTLCFAFILLLAASIPAVWALWLYAPPIDSKQSEVSPQLMEFSYDPGEIYTSPTWKGCLATASSMSLVSIRLSAR